MGIREELKESGQEACWLTKYHCPCMTGMCYSVLPDESCYIYNWFKKLIFEDLAATQYNSWDQDEEV